MSGSVEDVPGERGGEIGLVGVDAFGAAPEVVVPRRVEEVALGVQGIGALVVAALQAGEGQEDAFGADGQGLHGEPRAGGGESAGLSHGSAQGGGVEAPGEVGRGGEGPRNVAGGPGRGGRWVGELAGVVASPGRGPGPQGIGGVLSRRCVGGGAGEEGRRRDQDGGSEEGGGLEVGNHEGAL
jgi:hypothetical protein